MSHVATLVCTSPPALQSALAAAACAALPRSRDPVWLMPEHALDIPFAPDGAWDNRAAQIALREICGTAPIDVFVQPVAYRRKKLLLADMDSTMIGQECIDELADFVGQKAAVSEITERTMRGELAFEPSLRARVALLEGLDIDVVDRVIAQRITLTSGGPELVRTMRAHGAYTALVSGGFTLFTRAVGARIGFSENRANVLLVAEGRLTGRAQEPILGREAKAEALMQLRGVQGCRAEETLAVGDGANDLAMIAGAGLGVAFHAKPAVAAAAAASIDHCDLTALLFAQGYDHTEFVTA